MPETVRWQTEAMVGLEEWEAYSEKVLLFNELEKDLNKYCDAIFTLEWDMTTIRLRYSEFQNGGIAQLESHKSLKANIGGWTQKDVDEFKKVSIYLLRNLYTVKKNTPQDTPTL